MDFVLIFPFSTSSAFLEMAKRQKADEPLPRIIFGTSSLGNLFSEPSHAEKKAAVKQAIGDWEEDDDGLLTRARLRIKLQWRNDMFISVTTLRKIMRNDLGLHSPKFGCGAAQCGSCAVLLDGDCKVMSLRRDAVQLDLAELHARLALDGRRGGAEGGAGVAALAR